jgi:glycosyltransferase involved in cell wall biosynthesis
MKILHTESGPNWGGQEYRSVIEILWLNSHGHKAWLACDPDSQSFVHATRLNVPVLPTPMKRKFSPSSLVKLWRFCRQEGVDVVQTHSPRDSWMCWPLYLMGHPVVRTRNITNPVVKPSRTFIYRFGCSHIIAAADCIKKDLMELTRVRPDRIDVVGEGVDLSVFNPQVDGRALRQELGFPSDVPLVGMIAMLRSEKRAMDFVDAAIEVLKAVPNARFVLVGDGAQRTFIERKIQDFLANYTPPPAAPRINRNISPIVLAGYRHDTNQVLAALDVVVIPSFLEARCRVLAEAFATGKAVVATKVGGIPEVVEDGVNGLLVPPLECQHLARAICRLITEPDLRARLARAAWTTAQQSLSLDVVMESTVGIYRKVIC